MPMRLIVCSVFSPESQPRRINTTKAKNTMFPRFPFSVFHPIKGGGGGGGGTSGEQEGKTIKYNERKNTSLSPPSSSTLQPSFLEKQQSTTKKENQLRPSNLILSGGGVKGIAFIGCVRYLEEQGMLSGLRNLIGTSFGSLVCYMACLGLSSEEMLTLVWDSLKHKEKRSKKTFLHTILYCVEHAGFDDGALLEKCIKRPLVQKFERTDITFLDFAKLTGKNLVVVGSNLTKATSEMFSLETTPCMSVVKALRISTSIPLLFEPIVHDGCIYMDGALYNNFPVDWLRANPAPAKDTVGILIDDDVLPNSSTTQANLISVAKLLLYSVLKRLNAEHERGEHERADQMVLVKISTQDLLDSLSLDAQQQSPLVFGYSLETMSFNLTMESAKMIMDYGFGRVSMVVGAETKSSRLDNETTTGSQCDEKVDDGEDDALDDGLAARVGCALRQPLVRHERGEEGGGAADHERQQVEGQAHVCMREQLDVDLQEELQKPKLAKEVQPREHVEAGERREGEDATV